MRGKESDKVSAVEVTRHFPLVMRGKESDKVSAVEVTRHFPLVLLVQLMLKERQRLEKLRRECDRKGTVGNWQQRKLRNCIFRGQHYNEILIKLGGLLRGKILELNLGRAAWPTGSAERIFWYQLNVED